MNDFFDLLASSCTKLETLVLAELFPGEKQDDQLPGKTVKKLLQNNRNLSVLKVKLSKNLDFSTCAAIVEYGDAIQEICLVAFIEISENCSK